MRLLVSGATGQLGHGLIEAAAELDGVELVPVVRPTARRSGAERIARAFPDTGLSERAVEGDVTRPLWGLDDPTLDRLAGGIDAVLHAAGEVDWTASERQLFGVNVVGALHGLEVARRLRERGGRCGLYCLVSSVHVAGARRGLVPEARFGPDAGRTRYEQSKWHAEEAVLEAAAAGPGPEALVARIGGLLGNSATGATVKRSSLYMLADEWDDLPAGLLPSFGDGRIDVLPRDVAGAALLRAIDAALEAEGPPPEIVHVCAGESAPRTDALIEIARSIDGGGRLARRRRVPLPSGAAVWASQNAERFFELDRTRGNALVGMRYLALDRAFERDRLAALIGDALPTAGVESLAELAFGLRAPRAAPAPDLTLARFDG